MSATTTTTILTQATEPRVNLLPPEILAEQRFRRVKLGLGAGVVGAAAVIGALYLQAVSDADQARYDLEQTQAAQARLQEQTSALGEIPVIYAKVEATETLLDQARQDEVRWSYYLNDLGLSVPDHVWLTTMTASVQDPSAAAATGTTTTTTTPAPTDPAAAATGTPGIGSVTFSGTAYSHDDVAEWLEVLAAQPGYADAYFTSSTERMEGTRQVVDFTSEVVVTDEALWDNYLQATGQ